MRVAAIEAGLVQSARAGDIHWRDRLRIITWVHVFPTQHIAYIEYVTLVNPRLLQCTALA